MCCLCFNFSFGCNLQFTQIFSNWYVSTFPIAWNWEWRDNMVSRIVIRNILWNCEENRRRLFRRRGEGHLLFGREKNNSLRCHYEWVSSNSNWSCQFRGQIVLSRKYWQCIVYCECRKFYKFKLLHFKNEFLINY